MSAQLEPKQLAVIESLLAGSTISAAAQTAGIHRSTIYEWLRQAPFQTAIDEARRTRAQAIRDDVQALAESALGTVRSVLADPEARTATRLRAALAVLKTATDAEPVTRFSPQNLTGRNFDRFYDAVYLAAHREAVASAGRLAELIEEETRASAA